MKYNPDIVTAYFRECGLPAPVFEHRFHDSRRWRFDLAWPWHKLALEVQGAIFTGGRHVRGAAMLKEYEKLNNAAMLGWRVMFVQPSDLLMTDTVEAVRSALGQSEG